MADGRKGILCKYYLAGVCRLGDACQFSHDRSKPLNQVCQYYLQGNCRFGERCRYEHTRPDWAPPRGGASAGAAGYAPPARRPPADDLAGQLPISRLRLGGRAPDGGGGSVGPVPVPLPASLSPEPWGEGEEDEDAEAAEAFAAAAAECEAREWEEMVAAQGGGGGGVDWSWQPGQGGGGGGGEWDYGGGEEEWAWQEQEGYGGGYEEGYEEGYWDGAEHTEKEAGPSGAAAGAAAAAQASWQPPAPPAGGSGGGEEAGALGGGGGAWSLPAGGGADGGSGSGSVAHPALRSLCMQHFREGKCAKGSACALAHGDRCERCGHWALHPADDAARAAHVEECMLRHERLVARARSADVECGICLEKVLAKPAPGERKFGLLSCDHPFCLGCIRAWRQKTDGGADVETALRTCPICRGTSWFITPSTVWPASEGEKAEIVEGYKGKLATIDCKWFARGEGTCPFGTSCFYRHAFPDGRLEEPSLRKAAVDEGELALRSSRSPSIAAEHSAWRGAMGSSFEVVVAAFAQVAAELREGTLLRADDSTRQLYAQDLEAIEATVRALELKLRDIRAFVKREKEAIPQVEAVVEACQLQRAHLQHIAGHLPTYLPSLESPAGGGGALRELGPSAAGSNQQQQQQQGGEAGQPAAKKRPAAPRRYISQAELESASSYMRGRLTTDKINAALDEMAGIAEANAAAVAAVRRNRAVGADKKHAMWLAYNIANHEGLKGRVWVLEADLRAGQAVRLDKSGKAMMQLLRHLGRTSEVQLPAYVDYVKTGSFKELAPLDPDWYYIRAAAVARRVYINQGLGVGQFRRIFGGRSHAKGKGAGGIVRHALQQLEALGLVEKNPGAKGGRRITPKGQSEMDLVATTVSVPKFHYL
eukprot:scaffold5.g775.t1